MRQRLAGSQVRNRLMGFLVVDFLISAAERAEVLECSNDPERNAALIPAGAAADGALLASSREKDGKFPRNRHMASVIFTPWFGVSKLLIRALAGAS